MKGMGGEARRGGETNSDTVSGGAHLHDDGSRQCVVAVNPPSLLGGKSSGSRTCTSSCSSPSAPEGCNGRPDVQAARSVRGAAARDVGEPAAIQNGSD